MTERKKEESVWEQISASSSKALVIQAAASVIFTWETMKSHITMFSSQLSSSASWVLSAVSPLIINRGVLCHLAAGVSMLLAAGTQAPAEPGVLPPQALVSAAGPQVAQSVPHPKLPRLGWHCTAWTRKKPGLVVLTTTCPAQQAGPRKDEILGQQTFTLLCLAQMLKNPPAM